VILPLVFKDQKKKGDTFCLRIFCLEPEQYSKRREELWEGTMTDKDWVYKTPTQVGYHKVITPENGELLYISYHRLIISPGDNISLESKDQEVCTLCLQGKAKVTVEGESGELAEKDGVYIPCQSTFTVQNEGRKTLDCVLALAPSDKNTEPVFISFQEVDSDFERHKVVGKGVYERDVYTMVGPQIEASRLLVGYTMGRSGQWTSWPPHEHSDTDRGNISLLRIIERRV